MNVKKFEKDGKTVWDAVSAKDGKTRYSVAIECVSNNLDLPTGNINTEKSIVWMRSENKDTALEVQGQTIDAIKTGVLKPFRAFSATPFYEGQDEDINPTTEAKLGRYSQVRLCPAEQHATLHRQFVAVAPIVEEAQPTVEENAETKASA